MGHYQAVFCSYFWNGSLFSFLGLCSINTLSGSFLKAFMVDPFRTHYDLPTVYELLFPLTQNNQSQRQPWLF